MDSKQLDEKSVSSSTSATGPTVAAADLSDPQNVNRFVQTLLSNFQGKLESMTKHFLDRLDEMNGRIDDIERNLSVYMKKAGIEETNADMQCQSTSQE